MNGLELSRAYWEAFGTPMLAEQFPEWEGRIAAGLVGSGSDCFGYDDAVSQDHDFEPGFCLFIPGEDVMDRQTAFRLERAYAKLPKEFRGFSRSRIDPVGGSRHGVIRAEDFFAEKLGARDAVLSLSDWLRVPESALFELSRGTLFRDDSGLMRLPLSRVREFPEEIRLKKLAGELLIMAQSGQYNYRRCLARGDAPAAQLCAAEFVKAALHTCFLLNRRYMPYYKWQYRALRELPLLSELADAFDYLLTSKNTSAEAEEKITLIEELAGVFIAELMEQDLTRASCGDLEKHAYSVNDHISDAAVRNLHILAAV